MVAIISAFMDKETVSNTGDSNLWPLDHKPNLKVDAIKMQILNIDYTFYMIFSFIKLI